MRHGWRILVLAHILLLKGSAFLPTSLYPIPHKRRRDGRHGRDSFHDDSTRCRRGRRHLCRQSGSTIQLEQNTKVSQTSESMDKEDMIATSYTLWSALDPQWFDRFVVAPLGHAEVIEGDNSVQNIAEQSKRFRVHLLQQPQTQDTNVPNANSSSEGENVEADSQSTDAPFHPDQRYQEREDDINQKATIENTLKLMASIQTKKDDNPYGPAPTITATDIVNDKASLSVTIPTESTRRNVTVSDDNASSKIDMVDQSLSVTWEVLDDRSFPATQDDDSTNRDEGGGETSTSLPKYQPTFDRAGGFTGQSEIANKTVVVPDDEMEILEIEDSLELEVSETDTVSETMLAETDVSPTSSGASVNLDMDQSNTKDDRIAETTVDDSDLTGNESTGNESFHVSTIGQGKLVQPADQADERGDIKNDTLDISYKKLDKTSVRLKGLSSDNDDSNEAKPPLYRKSGSNDDRPTRQTNPKKSTTPPSVLENFVSGVLDKLQSDSEGASPTLSSSNGKILSEKADTAPSKPSPQYDGSSTVLTDEPTPLWGEDSSSMSLSDLAQESEKDLSSLYPQASSVDVGLAERYKLDNMTANPPSNRVPPDDRHTTVTINNMPSENSPKNGATTKLSNSTGSTESNAEQVATSVASKRDRTVANPATTDSTVVEKDLLDLLIVYKGLFSRPWKKIPLEKMLSLGYKKNDIISMLPDTLELIAAEKIKCPSTGVPSRWKQKDLSSRQSVKIVSPGEADALLTGQPETAKRLDKDFVKPSTGETASRNERRTTPNIEREGIDQVETRRKRRERQPASEKKISDQSVSDRMPPAASRKQARNRRERVATMEDGSRKPVYSGRPSSSSSTSAARRRRDPPSPNTIWPDMEMFRKLLRSESDLRLRVLGTEWADTVKQEATWRHNLYSDWLWVLNNGIGSPIVESRSDRYRRLRDLSQQEESRDLRKRRERTKRDRES